MLPQPCVLTEIGFMSNAAELAYVRSEKGQKALAGALCNAVEEYFAFMRGELDIDNGAAPEPAAAAAVEDAPEQPAQSAQPAAQLKRGFTVQVLASAKKVAASSREFKGRKDVKMYRGSGKFPYRYCIGSYATRSEAQAAAAQIGKTFNGAFVAEFSGDKIVK